jgi:hypothetical protein
MNILICDDTVQPLTGLSQDLVPLAPAGSDIQVVTGDAVAAIAEDLELRRRSAMHAQAAVTPWGQHRLDSIDLLIIDYNFVELAHATGLTGHRLAYLARCYSNAKYIVVLNQFGDNRFDLTLRGHPEAHADLHLGLRQATNVGLWSSADWPAFRPWVWPVLPAAVERLARITHEVAANPDARVLEHLHLADRIGAIPRNVRQFLGHDEITFRDFALTSGHGFDVTDRPFDEAVIPRVAASRIAKWLDHMVFAAQDLLVDAPRLLSRFPSLLGEAGLASLADTPLTPEWQQALQFTAPVEEHAYNKADWLSKSAWWRPELLDDDRILENMETTSPDATLRFAEDASRFLPPADVSPFVADLASPFVQRFVRRVRDEDIDYQPQLRFAL